MNWNRQNPDCPYFQYRHETLAAREALFLRQSGVVVGTVKHLGGEDRPQLVIELISTGELWKVVEPLLPKVKRRRRLHPGRKPISHRQALAGILFVLRTGIPWAALPLEMGCGSKGSWWRRLVAWQCAGVWARVHQTLLTRLQAAGKIEWTRTIVDSSSVRAMHGEKKQDPRALQQDVVVVSCLKEQLQGLT